MTVRRRRRARQKYILSVSRKIISKSKFFSDSFVSLRRLSHPNNMQNSKIFLIFKFDGITYIIFDQKKISSKIIFGQK